jgi:alkylhydroperoxidase/carboxymuconolactone decarboxylase family protein YurZ
MRTDPRSLIEDEPDQAPARERFAAEHAALRPVWESIAQASRNGPLDRKAQRLTELGIAIGSLREGAIRSSARQALAAGVSMAEVAQVVALAAGVVGLPGAAAAHVWLCDVAEAKATARKTAGKGTVKGKP